MNSLFELQELFLANIFKKERYLINKINWSNRLIAIKGARGSGKTTLLLQQIKFYLPENAQPQGKRTKKHY